MKIRILAVAMLVALPLAGPASAAYSEAPSALNTLTVAQVLEPTTWDKIEGNWTEYKGKVRQRWGKLTDNDLEVMKGRREELRGLIQQRYGISFDEADKEIDGWMKSPSK